MKDQNSQAMKQDIEKCLWRANNFGAYQKDDLKIASEVATDNDKEEFIAILRDGSADNMKSRYAKNFKYFEGQIVDFLNNYPSYFAYMPARILKTAYYSQSRQNLKMRPYAFSQRSTTEVNLYPMPTSSKLNSTSSIRNMAKRMSLSNNGKSLIPLLQMYSIQ